MKLYFVRHGQTDLNRDGRIQGRLDADMNLVGFKQARLCAKRLSKVQFDYAFCSPLKRAVQTAEEILRGRDVVIHKMALLNDTDVGEWQGHYWSEIAKKFSINLTNISDILKARGGESFEVVQRRTEDFFAEIEPLNANNILVVSHAAIAYSAVKKIFDTPKDKRIAAKCDNASISIFERDNKGRWILRTLNDTAHLEDF